MKDVGFALVACAAAALLSGAVGGCGGATAPLVGDGGTGSSNSSSSGGGSSSSSGGVSSSSGSGGGISSSSSSGSGSGSGGFGSSSSSGSGSGSGGFGSSSGGSSSSSSGGGYGNLTFEQCTGTSSLCGGASMSEFYGQFAEGPSNQGCTVETSGACSYYACANAPTPAGISAGTLTLYGGSFGTGVSLPPEAGNPGQYTYSTAGASFSEGQVLTVSSTGGIVPAFAFGPLMVSAPYVATLTSPAATGGVYTITTSADLAVAWTGGVAPAQMIVEGTGTDAGANSYFLCQWDATLGSGTVPAQVLTQLAGQTGFLVYGQLTTTNLQDDGYAISLAALQYNGGTADYH